MARNASNNPRQIRAKGCNCLQCAAKFRPGTEATRKDCTGPWQARWRNAAGEPKARNFPVDKGGKRAAEAHLDKVRSEIRDRTHIDTNRSGITLRAWHEKWEKAQRGAETSLQRDSTSWKVHLEPEFGGWKLAEIGHLDVDTWVARKGVGVYAVIKSFRLMDRMMAAALRDRRIPFNPCDGVKLPKTRAKHPDDLRPPTYPQLKLVRQALPIHYHPLMIVAEETGLRWGELVDLRLSAVDFAAGNIAVREVIVELDGGKLLRKEQPKSSAGFRTIPLTSKAADAMREQMRLRRPAKSRTHPGEGMHKDELIFRGPLGGILSRNNFRRLWTPATKSAGIARIVKNKETGRNEWWPHVHDIRHAFASRLHDEGVPEATVQYILGHERGGRVTWLYEHAPAEALENVRQVLDPGPRLRVVNSN